MLDVRVTKSQGTFMVEASFLTPGSGVTALFGPSGAGKTSVINMVAGLVRPDTGRIVINGKTCFDSENGIHVRPEHRRFGYIFQEGRLFPHLSVKSNLTYGMKLVPPGERFVAFDQVVELLGVKHLLNRRPAKLSGGEKQRVAIGRALLTSPHLMLMDEPLASLDDPRKAELLPFIARLPEDFAVPIVYVSHSVEEVLALAQTLVVMENGRITARGNPHELLKRRIDEGARFPRSECVTELAK
jgi:molybdate transport system ATP-binding protein